MPTTTLARAPVRTCGSVVYVVMSGAYPRRPARTRVAATSMLVNRRLVGHGARMDSRAVPEPAVDRVADAMGEMDTDAIVIGSGPNGLVAANLLSDQGWRVQVIEAQPVIGGAVKSDEAVSPGWVHDTFSSFYPLAAASPTIQGLGLERHGLEWVHAPAPVGHSLVDGSWAVIDRDRERTAVGLDALEPGDGAAWLRLCEFWDRIGTEVMEALLTPFPPLRAGARLATKLPRLGGMAGLRQLALPVRRLGDEWFRGDAPKLLLAGNAAHADIGVDSPGSGLMGLLLCMLGQNHGFPVPKGGAGMLAAALARRLESNGGTILTGCRVDEVLVRDGRAVGVRLDTGDSIRADRAVLADVSATALYGDLVPWSVLPTKVRDRMSSFDWDPGTVKVDWALSGPVPWRTPPASMPGTVHLADSVADLAASGAQLRSGRLPQRGLVIIGQMATTDPSRAPEGAESLWAYAHVPHRSAGLGDDELEGFVDNMESRLADQAPGFRDLVLERRVLGPSDLHRLDENLVGGSVNGGTASVHQQLFWRPMAGGGRAETPIDGLYLASASAHPGGGVHGACGANAARAALFHDRLGRFRPLGRSALPIGR